MPLALLVPRRFPRLAGSGSAFNGFPASEKWIAAAYDNLYEPGALIDMADHLRNVCAFVEGGVSSSKTRITVEAVRTQWPVERVVPLSLIANELLTNAVKHATPDQDLAIEAAQCWIPISVGSP